MNHAERQRLKDFERGKRMLWKLGLSWRQLNEEEKWWRLGLFKKHEKNWHIIMRKIDKELDDERSG